MSTYLSIHDIAYFVWIEPSGIFAPNSRVNDGYHKHNDDMGDEMENDADEAAEEEIYRTSKGVTWPTDLEAYLKFGYDNTMKAQLAKDSTTFAKWIDANFAHVQAYYRHNTLPTRINFKVYKYKYIDVRLYCCTNCCIKIHRGNLSCTKLPDNTFAFVV